jgi:hypothetical protein
MPDILQLGIPVFRSKFVPDRDSKGFLILGYTVKSPTGPQLILGCRGWEILNCPDPEEQARLCAEAATLNSLNNERLMLEPFEETLRAFGWEVPQ